MLQLRPARWPHSNSGVRGGINFSSLTGREIRQCHSNNFMLKHKPLFLQVPRFLKNSSRGGPVVRCDRNNPAASQYLLAENLLLPSFVYQSSLLLLIAHLRAPVRRPLSRVDKISRHKPGRSAGRSHSANTVTTIAVPGRIDGAGKKGASNSAHQQGIRGGRGLEIRCKNVAGRRGRRRGTPIAA